MNGQNGVKNYKMHDCKMVQIDSGEGTCDDCGCSRLDVAMEDGSLLWDCLNTKCLQNRYNETYRRFIYSTSYSDPGKFVYTGEASFWPIGYLMAISKLSYFRKVKCSDISEPRFFMLKHAFIEILKGHKRGVRIYSSEKGIGKTHAMIAFIKHLYYSNRNLPELSKDIKFVREVDLFSELKAAFRNDEASSMDVLEKYKTSDYLFIDDFGSAFKSSEGKWAQQIYYDLLDYRWSNSGKLIINTNLDENELQEYLDERAYNRLLDFPLITVKAPEGGTLRGKF